MLALRYISWLVVLLAVMTQAKAEEACVPEPGKLRYDDPYACFRDPGNRDGFPGAIKFIPLSPPEHVFLSLGGEVRQRYEYTHNPRFGADPQDKAGVWLQRYKLHGDLNLGPHIRVFAQLSSALESGRTGGPSPVDKNELTLQNAFVDLNLPLGPKTDLTLRGGRQELQLGSGRLVDVREGPNVRRTFDAARATLNLPDWQVEALVARPRLPRPGVFDDEANDDQMLWGVYATGGEDWLRTGALDLYYLGFQDDAGAFAQGTARERRHSIGARFHGTERGWDWNWETAYQFGRFGDGNISAWTIASETGFTFEDRPWRPRIALSANIASGDSDPADADLGTLNPLYPRGNYFSQSAVLGPRNFFNFHPFITIQPRPAWSLTVDANAFWRMETADGVYAPAGALIREPAGSKERYVGSALSVTSHHTIADNLGFTATYSHFFAGKFIRDTGPARDIDFIDLALQYKF